MGAGARGNRHHDHTQAPDTGGPNRHTTWLTTLNPDGTPHVTPIGRVQIDGVWYFNSGPATRKSRNIAANPRCVVSIATHPFDLVLEGSAERVTAVPNCGPSRGLYRTVGPPSSTGALTAEYSAPSAGPPPWHVYRIKPATVYAFGTAEPGGATKFVVGGDD